MDAACYNVHDQLSPRLYNVDVLDDRRPSGLTSPQEARRRISQQTQVRLLGTQKSKSNEIIVALAWGMGVEYVERNNLSISDRIPREGIC